MPTFAQHLPARAAELVDASEVAAPDPSRPPWPGRHDQVGGTDIFVRPTPSTGSGEPALYVHGLGGASTNFTDLADLLSPWLAAEAIDLPGFGRSGPSISNDYSIANHARILTNYLEQSGRGAVHLIGNSMGGAISIEIASRRPDLVRTLTLISPAVPDLRPKRGEDALLPLLMLPGIGPRMIRRNEAVSPQARARGIVELCFAHPELVPAHRMDEAAQDIIARRDLGWSNDAFLSSLRGIAATYLSYGAASPWRKMAAITAPTLVVWGRRDRLVDVSKAARVAATIPDATLLVLEEVGHTAQLEDPVSTARAFVGLLRRAYPPES